MFATITRLLWIAALAFNGASCGGTKKKSSAALADSGATTSTSGQAIKTEDIPTCDVSTYKKLVFDKTKQVFQYCDETGWNPVKLVDESTTTSEGTASTIVKRDASGNFSGKAITADSFKGKADSATKADAVGTTSATDIAATVGTVQNATSTSVANALIKRDSSGNFAAGAITATSLTVGGSAVDSTALAAANAATSTNTASAIVKRDGSGNFAAGTITATAFSGSGASLTNLDLEQTCGRLTLSSTDPVGNVSSDPTDVTAGLSVGTTIYFLPFKCGRIPLYDGTNWSYFAISSSGVSLDLTNIGAFNTTTESNFDIFIYSNGGTLTLSATAWASDTARTTNITRQDGVYVKSGSTGLRYLGTARLNGTAYTVQDNASKRYLWNYNYRTSKPLVRQETTASGIYGSATWREARGSTSNRVHMVRGLNEDQVTAHASCSASDTAGHIFAAVGIGINSTTSNSAQSYGGRMGTLPLSSDVISTTLQGHYKGFPGIGYRYIAWLESTQGTNTTFAYSGTGYQSGLIVEGGF